MERPQQLALSLAEVGDRGGGRGRAAATGAGVGALRCVRRGRLGRRRLGRALLGLLAALQVVELHACMAFRGQAALQAHMRKSHIGLPSSSSLYQLRKGGPPLRFSLLTVSFKLSLLFSFLVGVGLPFCLWQEAARDNVTHTRLDSTRASLLHFSHFHACKGGPGNYLIEMHLDKHMHVFTYKWD